MWQAEIVGISNVDASGNCEILYKILVDGKVKYDSLQAVGKADNISDIIKQQMSSIKTQVDEITKLKVGDIINL